MAFNLNDYEPVESRIARFWDKYPNGRIHTEIVLINEKEVVIKASAYTDREDNRAAAIDFAQESVGTTGVNRTSWVENCSTSAIGRCLATLNFSPKGKRPSREEMMKAANQRDYLAEASNFAGQGDLEGLRSTYALAEAAKVPADTLKAIQELAQALKAK